MAYQEWIEREAEQANDAQQAERFSEYAAWTVEELEAWTRMMEPEPETTTERLRRVERHEQLVRGLQHMLLCPPLYGEAACKEIKRLLRGRL
jgi:hypothetical protein